MLFSCIDNKVCILLECFVCCYIEHCTDTVQTFHLQCVHGALLLREFFVSASTLFERVLH